MNDKIKTYLFQYFFEGAEYGFEIKAYSKEEAERRVRVISLMARYQGEIMSTIHVPTFIERLINRVRSFILSSITEKKP